MKQKSENNGQQIEELEDRVSHILEEARMVLPGIQALLGFQLIAVFNPSFKRISAIEQDLHLAAIFCSISAICLLMTPTAWHRICEPKTISEDFATLSSRLIATAMVPLLLSFTSDFFVVAHLVSENYLITAILTMIIALALSGFWFIWPMLHCRRSQKKS